MIGCKHIIKNFIHNKNGGILILGAASLVMLTTLVGGAVDYSRYMNVNSKFKNAVDNALLSAAPVARSQNMTEVTKKFFYANFPKEYMESLVLTDIKVVENKQEMSWTVNVDANVKTTFSKFLGFDNFHIHHKAKIEWDISRRVEAIFTLDTSASMCMTVDHSKKEDSSYIIKYTPDYTCKKLNALKESMNYVIDNGFASIQGIDGPAFHAGIIPFNHKIKLPNQKSIPVPLLYSEQNITGGDANYFNDFTDAEPLSTVIPLMPISSDADKTKMKNLVNGIVQSPTGLGWTRSNIATLTAALMLDPQYYSAFGGAEPSAMTDKKTDKIVVMMTDGANIGCCFAAHPEGNYDNQYLYLYEADNAHLMGLNNMSPDVKKWAKKYNIPDQSLCKQMKDAGITIYSVIYDVNDNDPGGKAIKDAYKSCASNPEQYYFDVKSEAELKLAYKTIAQSLLRIRLTY